MTRGFTLFEMMVAVLVLGLLATFSSLSVRSLDAGPGAEVVRDLRATRAQAVREGEARLWRRGERAIRFLPDGSSSGGVVRTAGKTFVIDPVTGGVREAP